MAYENKCGMQYNNLIALFDNWDMYTKALQTSQQAEGTLQKQQDTFLESTAAHLQKLDTAIEGVQDSLFKTEGFNQLLDVLTNIVGVIENIVDGMGGLGPIMTALGGIALNVFNKQIGQSVGRFFNNIRDIKNNKDQLKGFGAFQGTLTTFKENFSQKGNTTDKRMEALTNFGGQLDIYKNYVSPEQFNEIQKQRQELDAILKREEEISNQRNEQQEQLNDANKSLEAQLKKLANISNVLEKYDENINVSEKLKEASNNIEEFRKKLTEETFAENINGIVQEQINNYEEAIKQLKQEISNTSFKDLTGENKKEAQKAYGQNIRQLAQATGINLDEQIFTNASGKEASLNKILHSFEVGALGKQETIESYLNQINEKVLPQIEEKIDGINNTSEKTVDAIENINKKIKKTDEELKDVQQQGEKATDKLSDIFNQVDWDNMFSSISEVSGAILSVVSSFETAGNLIKVWNDETLDTGEKLKQTIAGASGSLAQLIPNLVQGYKGLQVFKEGIGQFNISLASSNNGIAKLITSIGGIGPAGLIAVAAIIAIGVAIYATIKSINKENDALIQQQKELKETQKVYDELKQKNEEVLSTFDKYKEIQNSLEDLTKGTKEWNEALSENNNLVLSLLQEYPELAKYIERIGNKLTISEEGQKELSDKLQKEQEIALQDVYREQAETARAQIEVEKSKIRSTGYLFGDMFSGRKMTLEDIQVDKLIKEVQKSNGAILSDRKALSEELGFSSYETDLINQNLNQILGIVSRIQEQQLIAFETDTSYYQSILTSNKEGFSNLTPEQQNFVASGLAAQSYNKSSNIEGKTLNEFLLNNNRNITNHQDLINEYIKIIGQEGIKSGLSSGYNVEWKDAEGKIISTEPIEEVFNHYINLTSEKLYNSLIKFSKTENIDTLLNKGNNIADFSGLSANEILKLLNKINIEEDFEYFAYETAEEFKTAIEIGQRIQLNTVKDLLSGYSVDSNQINAISDTAARAYKDFRSQFIGYISDDSINALLDAFGNDFDKVFAIAKSIDWSAPDTAINKFNQALIEAEIPLKNSEEGLNTVAEAFEKTTTAADKLSTALSGLTNLIKQVSKFNIGDFIDAETYQNIIDKYGQIAEEYFDKMEDGSYRLKKAFDLKFDSNSIKEELEKFKKYKPLFEEATEDILSLQETNERSAYLIQIRSLIDNYTPQLEAVGIDVNNITTIEAYNKAIKALKEGVGEFSEETIQAKQNSYEYNIVLEMGSINLDNLNKALITGKITLEGYNNLKEEALQNDLTSLGLTKETIAQYAKLNNITERQAIAQLKSNKAAKETGVALEALGKKLDSGSNTIEENLEELNNLQKALKENYGIELDISQIPEQFEAIKQMLEGDKEAFTKLQLEFNPEFENVKEALNEITDDPYEVFVSGTVDESFIRALIATNQLMNKSPAELNKIISAFGYQIPTYTTYDRYGAHIQYAYDSFDNYTLQQVGDKKTSIDSRLTTPTRGVYQYGGDDKTTKSISKAETQHIEYQEHEIDLYEEVNRQINYYQNNIDKVNRKLQEENLTQEETLALLAEQEEYQRKQLQWQQEKLKIAEQERQRLSRELSLQGVTFDSNGNINQSSIDSKRQILESNIKSKTEARNKAEDDLVAAKNRGDAEEKIEALEEALKKAEEALEDVNEEWDKFNNSVEKFENNAKDINEYERSVYDLEDALEAADLAAADLEKHQFDATNREIAEIDRQLQRVQRQQKGLKGEALVENLQQQRDLEIQKLEVLKRQLPLYEAQLKTKQNNLQLILAEYGLQSAQFDQYGNLINIEEILLDIESKRVNLTEEQYRILYDIINLQATAASNYQSALDGIQSQEWTIEDIQIEIDDTILQNLRDEFKAQIEFDLDLSKAKRTWHEYIRRVKDDVNDLNLAGTIENRLFDIKSYYTQDIPTLTNALNTTVQQYKDILATGTSSIYGSDAESALKDSQQYRDQLISSLNEIQDMADEIQDKYLESIDKVNDKLSDQLSLYQQITSVIEHDKDLVSLIYGEDSYDSFDEYYNMQHQNNLEQAAFLREQVNFWEAQMNSVEVGSEEWEKFKANWIEAVNNLNDTVEQAVQNIIDRYQNSIAKAIDDLNKKVTSGIGLDRVNEQWELMNMNADAYLDTINTTYEIQSLQNKFIDSINNTDNIKAQERLTAIMDEQLEILRNKDKISKYDVERANMMYDIELKRLALEEARNNQTKMRLRRDSQGNYTYQFVADEDQIADAKNALLEAQNSLYNLDKDQYRQNLEEVYNIYEEFQNKIQELYNDNTLSDEEREARKLELISAYGERINDLIADNEFIRQNLQESTFDNLDALYLDTLDNLNAMTEGQQEILMSKMVPQWASALQEMVDNFSSTGGFVPMCEESLDELYNATEEYKQALEDIEEAAQINFDDIRDNIDDTIDKTQDLIYKNEDLVDSYKDEYEYISGTLIPELEALEEAYEAIAEAARKTVEEQLKLKRETTDIDTSSKKTSTTTKKEDSDKIDIGTAAYTEKKDEIKVGSKGTIMTNLFYHNPSDNENDVFNNWIAKGKNGIVQQISNGKVLMQYTADMDNGKSRQVQNWFDMYDDIEWYNTGGYTGAWGNEGKAAILHEKELVLNKEDTVNLLSAIDIVRSIANVLDNISSIIPKENNLGFSNIPITDQGDNLEQHVTIDAHFPNVTNSNEIEEAFSDLVNLASQRILRNRK